MNSVALHGDGCPICQSVEKELIKLSRDLNCSLQVGGKFLGFFCTLLHCWREQKIKMYPEQVFCSSYTSSVYKITLEVAPGLCFSFLGFFFPADSTRTRGSVAIWNKNVTWCLRMLCEVVDKTADEFFMFSPLQSAQSGSGVMDGCEGSQLYPPTPPIMLQVNCMTPLRLHQKLITFSSGRRD